MVKRKWDSVPLITRGHKKLFQLNTKAMSAAVMMMGLDSGMMIRRRTPRSPQPSILAASTTSWGMP